MVGAGAEDPPATAARPAGADAASRAWIADLRGGGRAEEEAVGRLHALLLRAARFEVDRRRAALPHLRADSLDDIALEAADDALMAVLGRIDDYRGAASFTTWVYKFALLEAAVKLRRRAWQAREVPLAGERWSELADAGPSPETQAEHGELVAALRAGIATALTPHQRDVLVAIVLEGVPVDVLSERLGTTRGALYKTLHDARRRLRGHLEALGLAPPTHQGA